jgi:hypothetical protein
MVASGPLAAVLLVTTMTQRPVDEKRERRILNEIVADAHDPEEQTMGWYAYRLRKLRSTGFPQLLLVSHETFR